MKKQIKEIKAKILGHQQIGPQYYNLRLLAPELARLTNPGQFVMLRVSEGRDPFLRRPFSLARIFPPQPKGKNKKESGEVEIWYQVKGRGTYLMSQFQEGKKVDILGPLGKGFWLEEKLKKAILVGGGIGIAPLIAWAEKIQGEKERRRPPEEDLEILVLSGGKKPEDILGWRELKEMNIEHQIITEDGSRGKSGLVTDLLESALMTGQNEFTGIYACGPWPMLAKVAQIAEQFDLPCQVLLESRLACGIGACLGCAVKVRRQEERTEILSLNLSSEKEEEELIGPSPSLKVDIPISFRYARVCQEGPVFAAQQIIWE